MNKQTFSAYTYRYFYWFIFIFLFVVGCSYFQPTVELPNPAVTPAPVATQVMPPSEGGLGAGGMAGDGRADGPPPDPLLEEIDADLCAEAMESLIEVELLMTEGEDLADLKAALEALMADLPNCPPEEL
ncbi:MAG TPA: hypothetical protein VLL52_01810 [Anaerolineae bacterium]|nr:hypothetical protein [Anaerolineae bacterium]